MYIHNTVWSLAIFRAVSAVSKNPNAQEPLRPISIPTLIDIPHLGFGTWNLSPDNHNASAAVSHAIQTGYRHIDCAAAYRNEPDVGRGIHEGLKKAGLRREDIWVTSKLWNNM
jgi:alcohol dehydrogenase (NADP+)